MSLSEGKLRRLRALSNEQGVITAAAMDQRIASLLRPIASAKGVREEEVTAGMMSEFKTAVTKVLSPYASAFLLDPDFGLPAIRVKSPQTGLLLAYEKLPYDLSRPGRMPLLAESLSVERLIELGAQGIKILIHYTPFEPDKYVNKVKHAFVERVGAECETHQIPFFLEFLGYDPAGLDERSYDFARKKPDVVSESMREFSKPRYRVDVLKVEIPVNVHYAEGSPVYTGPKAYSRQQALEHIKRAADAASLPFIYLSAGVDHAVFIESLRMAAEADTGFSGVLCGRATWKDGIPVYARGGVEALENWLRSDGVRNIQAINEVLQSARPWWAKLGMGASAA